jgi:hypothetical protein
MISMRRLPHGRWLAGLMLMAPPCSSGAGDCPPSFLSRIDAGTVNTSVVNEASGLAASRRNTRVWWTHNDSGSPNVIHALNDRGRHLGIYTITGLAARDWEDMAAGPGPVEGTSYLYIGNIGDNNAVYDLKYIGRIPEPAVDAAQTPTNATLAGVETITFRYANGQRDAETLMVDPWTRDLYIVSKRETNLAYVFQLPYPQPTSGITTAQLVATLGFSGAVGGDISPDGAAIAIKTYNLVYLWCRAATQTIAQALAAAPTTVPYTTEPQGEAVAWRTDGAAYYTLSEGTSPHLYFYPSQVSDTDGDGMPDGQEQVAGTDLFDAGSCFELPDAQVGESNIVVSWTGVAGRVYDVLHATDPELSPEVLVSNVAPVLPVSVWTSPIPPSARGVLAVRARVP